MQEVKIGRVLIERGAENDSLTKRILKKLPDTARAAVEAYETALPQGTE